MIIDIANCPICGGEHKDVNIMTQTNSVLPGFDHWGLCTVWLTPFYVRLEAGKVAEVRSGEVERR